MAPELHGFDPNCILLQFGPVHFRCIRTIGRKALEEEVYSESIKQVTTKT